MFHEEIVRSFDRTELYRCIDAPEPFRGTVVLLHGLGGHCRRFDEPVRRLNDISFLSADATEQNPEETIIRTL